MKVNSNSINPSLVNLIEDNTQILPVDANFFIPFDRSNINSVIQPLTFDFFEKIWIKPLFFTFPHLAIHESVYNEITVNDNSKKYIDYQISKFKIPILLKDKDLTVNEEIVRSSIEKKVAKYTNYEPEKNNSNDRGEVKSLSYIATKELLYFCSHDSNAIKLIENAVNWETNLESVGAIRTYEIIYYLLEAKAIEKDVARFLYKYLYFISKKDKRENPEWGEFIDEMKNLYSNTISSCSDFPDVSKIKF